MFRVCSCRNPQGWGRGWVPGVGRMDPIPTLTGKSIMGLSEDFGGATARMEEDPGSILARTIPDA